MIGNYIWLPISCEMQLFQLIDDEWKFGHQLCRSAAEALFSEISEESFFMSCRLFMFMGIVFGISISFSPSQLTPVPIYNDNCELHIDSQQSACSMGLSSECCG